MMNDTIALTYRRVSTFKQEREGTSLDDQLRTCREYVRRHEGWQLGTEHCDVLTGRTAKRQDYQALIEEARQLRKAGQAVVVVTAALDRMGRDRLSAPVYISRPDRPKDVPALDRPVGHWMALVTDDVWTQVQAGIASHAKMPRQRRMWLLNGLIRCPKDGLRMQGRHERWGPIYRCGMPFRGC
jgi:hypothetical protein